MPITQVSSESQGQCLWKMSMSFAKPVSSHVPHWDIPVSAVNLTLWELEKLLHKGCCVLTAHGEGLGSAS